jgi:outer membrane protein OmpA-like peptidoglycan-associated protein
VIDRPKEIDSFAATYTVFGNIVKAQYPKLVASIYPVAEILDTSYVKELASSAPPTTQADLPTFAPASKVEKVVSRRSWDIQFATGSAKFSPQALAEMRSLLNDLVIAGGTLVEVHGHTDNMGGVAKNMKLSEERAFAVKRWLGSNRPPTSPRAVSRCSPTARASPSTPTPAPTGAARTGGSRSSWEPQARSRESPPPCPAAKHCCVRSCPIEWSTAR